MWGSASRTGDASRTAERRTRKRPRRCLSEVVSQRRSDRRGGGGGRPIGVPERSQRQSPGRSLAGAPIQRKGSAGCLLRRVRWAGCLLHRTLGWEIQRGTPTVACARCESSRRVHEKRRLAESDENSRK